MGVGRVHTPCDFLTHFFSYKRKKRGNKHFCQAFPAEKRNKFTEVRKMQKLREALIERKTGETDISLSLSVKDDCSKGSFEGTSGIGFFDHMLNSLAVHGGFDVKLACKGDLHVDCHHTIEDVGIALGAALNKVRGTGKGIARYANILLPMDEALCMCALDFSGRPFLVFDGEFSSDSIGGYDTQMTEEFFRAVAFNAGITLHIKIMYGKNDHHKTEACYKAFAKCISQALKLVSDDVPSAKGML